MSTDTKTQTLGEKLAQLDQSLSDYGITLSLPSRGAKLARLYLPVISRDADGRVIHAPGTDRPTRHMCGRLDIDFDWENPEHTTDPAAHLRSQLTARIDHLRTPNPQATPRYNAENAAAAEQYLAWIDQA